MAAGPLRFDSSDILEGILRQARTASQNTVPPSQEPQEPLGMVQRTVPFVGNGREKKLHNANL